MGSRTYHAHLAEQYIDELWKFVEIGNPEKIAYSGNAAVACRSLTDIGLVIHYHGAEFQAGKAAAKTAYTALNKENGTVGIEFDEKGNDGNKPAKYEDDHCEGKNNVKYSLEYQIITLTNHVGS